MFLDESGDLGFRRNSSSHFIVAIIRTESPKPLYNCIKKRRAKLAKKHQVQITELKHVPESVDIKALKCIRNKKLSIHYISLNKANIPYNLRKNHKKSVIQQYMIGHLVDNVAKTFETNEKLNLIIDKYLPDSKIGVFNNYIDQKICDNQINIEHESSRGNYGLQAVHIVVKGINKFYRDGDLAYYNIINNKIEISIDSKKITL
jgi:hypothetical protein